MRKLFSVVTLIVPLLFLTACSPLEQQARNTAAALQGAIVAAQASNQTSCAANANQQACTIINQSVAAQNALVTSTEAYCSWSTVTPPTDPKATCVPVKTAQGALQAAISNANTFVVELKGVIK